MSKYGRVEVIGFSDKSFTISAAAAKISHMEGTCEEIISNCEDLTKAERSKVIKRVPHPSILEHGYVNMMFNDVSMFVEQYMIENRLAAFTVKSRRYVDFGSSGYNLPDLHYLNEEDADDAIDMIVDYTNTAFQLYKAMIDEGIPKEDARYVLPYNFRSNFFVSMDSRNFIGLIKDMLSGEGSKYPEIKYYGEKLFGFFKFNMGFVDIDELIKKENATMKRDMISELKRIKSYHVTNSHVPDYSDNLVYLVELSEMPVNDIMRETFRHYGMPLAYNEQFYIPIDPAPFDIVIKDILSRERQRELEQVWMRFAINKISLATYTHLIRHRMQSINPPNLLQIVDHKKYLIPESIKNNSYFADKYHRLYELGDNTWKMLSGMGVSQYDKIYTFLCGSTISVTTSMNAAEFLHMTKLRCCNRAQWEIREIVTQMLNELKKKCPMLFSYFGPSCYVDGVCPEGRMSCGKMEEVCEKFSTK